MRALRRFSLCTSLLLGSCEPLSAARAPAAPDAVVPDQDALVVSPAELDFGALSVAADGMAFAEFEITNAGSTTIAVHGHDEVVDISGGDAELVFSVEGTEPVFELRPGERRDLQVRFAPPRDGRWEAEVRVNYGVELLRLEGEGTAPALQLRAPDPPATPFGCSGDFTLELSNAGREPLWLEGLELAEGADFGLVEALPTAAVAPQASVALPLHFTPAWADGGGGTRVDTLTLRSNDPTHPELPVALAGLAYGGERVTDAFGYHPGIATDLLFVVDTDGVMSIHVDKAQLATATLLQALDEGNVDLHAAVLTTAATCPETSPAWVSQDDPLPTREQALADGFDGASSGGALALVGHAVDALDREGGAGGCLEGFLRADAQLHVVLIAGGDDDSGATAEALATALHTAAPAAGAVRVSAIVATESAGCGGADYGGTYAQLALATGGEVQDLCQDTWTGAFTALAEVSLDAAAGGLRRPLDLDPLLDSLRVRVDSATFDAWTYAATDNAVVFSDSTAPEAGSTVEIRYDAAVDCPE